MRFALLCVISLVAAIPAAARTDQSLVAPASVSVLGADGGAGRQIAFLSSSANKGCGAVGLWRPGLPYAQLVPVRCGPTTSTGRGAYGLSFGGVLLWATYTGGNYREHTLWRSVPQGSFRFGPGRAVASVSHESSSPSPLIVGEGDDPYASYAIGKTAYTISRTKRHAWQLPVRPLGLVVHKPYLSVRLADGPVNVYLDGQENEVALIDYPRGVVLAVKAHGRLVAVLRRGALDVRGVLGQVADTFRLPSARSYGDDHCGTVDCPLAELRLADLQGKLAVYVHGRTIHVLRVTDGKDIVIRRAASGPVHAELDATGLSYTSGRRIFFIPRWEIDRRLRSA